VSRISRGGVRSNLACLGHSCFIGSVLGVRSSNAQAWALLSISASVTTIDHFSSTTLHDAAQHTTNYVDIASRSNAPPAFDTSANDKKPSAGRYALSRLSAVRQILAGRNNNEDTWIRSQLAEGEYDLIQHYLILRPERWHPHQANELHDHTSHPSLAHARHHFPTR
jgi:hypothetical protein